MRILTIPFPAPAHLTAMVPLCWALRGAGHDLLVVCQPDIAATARAAGLSVAVIGAEAKHVQEIQQDTSEDMFPAEAFGQRDTEMGRFLWQMAAIDVHQHAADHLADYLRVAAAWKPDIVLYDHMALVGRLVGELLHVPSAAHRWGVDPTSGPFEERSAELFAPLCARHGLPGLPKPRVILDPCPPDIQAVDAEPGHPMRYIPFNGTGVLPEWVSGRAKRRVAVSMGGTTLTLAGPSSFQRVIEALGGVPDIEVVVALSAQDLDLVGGLPDEFRVTEWLPLNLFVQTCDLLIHHGGSGTGLTAAAYGVPQLVLPQFADAFDYGRGIAASGAGVTVPDAAGQSDVDGLAKTITALLDDAGYRDGATALRERMQAAPSLASVAAMLTELEI